MQTINPILECVPNFSEGRDTDKIEAIAGVIREVEGVALLHIDISPAANRTVMTFAGAPEAVVEAAFRAIEKAAELIDMRKQTGVHPRIGATDVCPLVPLFNMQMEEVVALANVLAQRVGKELNIPVYLYEYAAKQEHRRALPDVRKGQYEGFGEKMKQEQWQPDYGPKSFNAATGATVIGARDVLVAFNIGLATQDVSKASFIAARIRERGYIGDEGGERKRVSGLLPKVRAIGWFMEDYHQAQVSFNLLDYRHSSPLKVWETCQSLAADMGVELHGSEVIGLIPERCMLEAGSYTYLRKQELPPAEKQLIIHEAIKLLQLDLLKPFEPQEKILEYALFQAGLLQ